MKKRNIALVELYGHSEVLYNLFKLLKNDFELTIFTTQKIYVDAQDYFETELHDWQIKSSSTSIESFVKENLEKLNAQDVLIFTTLISSFKFFSTIDFRPLTIVTTHNINTSFNFNNSIWLDKSSVKNYVFDVLRFLRSKIQRDVFFRERLFQKVDFISCSSENLSNYARAISPKFLSKILHLFPFSFFENHKREEKHNEIIISIPGSVTNKLRNYEIVFEALEEMIPNCSKKITLQFLGFSNNKLGTKFINLENENFQLISFNKSLSQKEFDNYLKQTDFIILPLKKDKKFGIIREEYGKSSISGGVNDIVRFGIPTLLIDSYKVEKSFSTLVSTFENKTELVEQMTGWIENSRHLEIRKKAIPELEKINEENTRIELVKRIENLLS
ncbi:MAG: hypothetical protein P8Q41_01580 [Saprospiraceae bacterium]|nr:hypothetical protein [Saprospiraceae bacterium]